MQCRRCGEENMPGLSRCFSCGVELNAPAPLGPTVPKVRAANPLAPPRRREGSPVQRTWARVTRLRWGILLYALFGLIPGLGAWRRGERRLASMIWAGTALGLALIPLTWTSIHHAWAWVILLSSLGISSSSEVRAQSGAPPPWDVMIGGVMGFAALALFWAGGQGLFSVLRPRVQVADTPHLDGGVYLIRDLNGPVEADDLLAINNTGRLRYNVYGPLIVASVLAGPGQTVSGEGGRILVDGAPAAAHPLNPAAPIFPPEEPIWVPEGHVLMMAAPLTPIPITDVIGELYYRWSPTTERGPIRWPPEETP